MSLPQPESTAMADISANIFAALILVLIVTIASGQFRRMPSAAPSEPVTIETSTDPRLVSRPVLPPAAMVDVLAGRAKPGRTVSLEVTRRGISLALGGVEENIAVEAAQTEATLRRLLADRAAATTIQVLVLDNATYAEVPPLLHRLGITNWKELTIPAALRSEAGDWSDGFRSLIGRSLDTADFRNMLARLLAGGASRGMGNWEEITGRPAPLQRSIPRPQLPPAPTFDLWLPALNDVLTTFAILAAVLFVWRVERRVLQRQQP